MTSKSPSSPASPSSPPSATPDAPVSPIRAAILARLAAKKVAAAKPRPPAGRKPQEVDSERQRSGRFDREG